MNNFLRKEIKLCLSPINYVFLSFAFMMIVPNYPSYVAFFYIGLSCFFIFNNGLINKDIQYSMVLPITKSDIVKSRCILIAAYEVIFFILTIPFSILRVTVVGLENKAGIEANVAFYGFCMIMMTVYHFVFFTNYYKKANKPGLPLLLAELSLIAVYFLVEVPVWVGQATKNEFLLMLDSVEPSDLLKQLPILAVGLVIYVLGWLATYKKSAKIFEKVDL